jgi:hypothetical protein
MNFKLIPAALALFACTVATAAPNEPLPWVAGIGAQSCGQFLEAVRTKNEPLVLHYITWTQGYMSGVNSLKDAQAKNLKADAGTIRAYLTKHCQDKPLDDFTGAVQGLIVGLWTKE